MVQESFSEIKMPSKYFLYFNTLKYLKPIQLYGRIFSGFKQPLTKYDLPELTSPSNGIKIKIPFLNHDPWNSIEKLKHNEFTFLNLTHNFNKEINWQKENLPLLWLFNLHYFGYLYLFPKSDQIKIIEDWITNNPVSCKPGWHPYPTSLRIVNWIKADLLNVSIQKSIYNQSIYLYRNLEFYHPANHYLENAKALIFAGNFFKGNKSSNKLYEKGVKILKAQLPVQILEDGTFFELSPMYHAIILEGLLDLLNILDDNSENYQFIRSFSEKMLYQLKNLTHPDGDIALINDSTTEIASRTEEIIHYADQLSIKPLSPKKNLANLFTYKNDILYFILKVYEIGPDHIPAHSHADIFSYELSYKGKRFIVDSGNYSYENEDMRKYFRSTEAHNTVSIDGKDQAEMWDILRVARRYKAKNVSFINNTNGFIFSGIFKGYSDIIGDELVHKRIIETRKDSSQISIIDEISGTGNHTAESYIHLHPEISISKSEDYLILSVDGSRIKLKINDSQFLIKEGWYCPQFGKKIKNKVIIIYSNKVPSTLSYHFYLE